MEITLKNIGIVKNSTIKLHGLTVITGQNNSGKTTIGKVVYSLLDAVSNIKNKARNDKLHYIQKSLDEVEFTIDFFRFFRGSEWEDKDKYEDKLFPENPGIKGLFGRRYRHKYSRDGLEDFAHNLYDELSSLDSSLFMKNKEFLKHVGWTSTKDTSSHISEMLNEQIIKAVKILKNLFDNLSKDPDLVDYTRESINQTLKIEFANQIQPISKATERSEVKLTKNDLIYFNFEIMNNNIVNNNKPIFVSPPYKKTYFIDDPFILNTLSVRERSIYREHAVSNSYLNSEKIITHEKKLKLALRTGTHPSVFEEIILNDSLSKIKKQIDEVIPGEFEFSSEGEYYVQNGNKLNVTNLATGSKMFSILKILLEKGEINDTTMLILDEPEAHLHPSWQNKFAEIIVLLVKELSTNILLTTHSPNFMLAIDAYMRKYDISSKTNFYQTHLLEDGFVDYTCVNNDLGKIYADFMQYLSEVKALRDKHMANGYGEEDDR